MDAISVKDSSVRAVRALHWGRGSDQQATPSAEGAGRQVKNSKDRARSQPDRIGRANWPSLLFCLRSRTGRAQSQPPKPSPPCCWAGDGPSRARSRAPLCPRSVTSPFTKQEGAQVKTGPKPRSYRFRPFPHPEPKGRPNGGLLRSQSPLADKPEFTYSVSHAWPTIAFPPEWTWASREAEQCPPRFHHRAGHSCPHW